MATKEKKAAKAAPKAPAKKAPAKEEKAKPSTADMALKTANEAAAEVRKLRTQMEAEGVITNAHANMRGGDLFHAKKAAGGQRTRCYADCAGIRRCRRVCC